MSDHYVCKSCDEPFDKCECERVIEKKCKCGKPVEAYRYDFCYNCWWDQDPRNIKNGGTVDMSKYEDDGAQFALADKKLESMDDLKKDYEGPQPGPPMPPTSLNNRLIVEQYTTDRGLKSTEKNGFAMISQKVNLKGLKVLMNCSTSMGGPYIREGDMVYIREELLHTQVWANKTYECDAIKGRFMIVDLANVEFIVPK